MSRVRFALLVLLVIAFAGCGKSNKESGEQQQQPAADAVPAQPAPSPESSPAVQEPEGTPPAATPEQAKAPAVRKAERPRTAPAAGVAPQQEPPATAAAPVRKESAEPPKPPEPRLYTVPSGTNIQVRLQDSLSTGVNQTGDTFRAILDQDLVVDGKTIAARGSILQGKLSNVVRPGRVEGRAAMSMQLTSLAIDSQTYPIQTGILAFEGESTKKKDATKVGVGAGIGAVIGAIAGGGKGAAIGAAVGGGAGGATVLATRGKELVFDSEHKLRFELTHDLNIKKMP